MPTSRPVGATCPKPAPVDGRAAALSEQRLELPGEASTLVRMGDVAGAETLLDSALSTVDPATMAGIEIAYAEIAHNREDWPEAARRWAVARSHSDLDPILYLRGSESLRRAGDTAEADRLLDSALFLFPRHPEVAGVVAEREAATLQAGAAKPAA